MISGNCVLLNVKLHQPTSDSTPRLHGNPITKQSAITALAKPPSQGLEGL
jgi:hypothetical protein